jgi:hypothetical protein
MPTSSRSSSLDIAATSSAVRPFTISMSIEVDAWLIAHPRPRNLTSSILSPSKLTKIETSSPQSGFWPSASTSAPSITPWPRGFL